MVGTLLRPGWSSARNNMRGMAELDWAEEETLVQLFQMSGGYVLDFSNWTFSNFFERHRIDIDNERYFREGGSKGRRMRTFLNLDPDHAVGRVIKSMIDYGVAKGLFDDLENAPRLIESGRQIAARLMEKRPVADIEALIEGGDGRDLEQIVEHIRRDIDDGRPEAALDRLHTYMVKYVRRLCQRHGIEYKPDTVLHSLFGLYSRALHEGGHIETKMSTVILRETGKVLDAFNDVRNNHSYAHDNDLLSSAESLFILNNVAATVRFLNELEAGIVEQTSETVATEEAGLPF